MELAPGVHRIACRFDVNRISFVHLFVGTQASMLVDTCCAHNPEQDILPYMQKIGFNPKRLTYILISHSDLDHQGGNAPMKQAAPQAILMCHNLDRPWIESTEALIDGRYDQFSRGYGVSPMSAEARANVHAQTLSAPIDMTLEGGERFRLSDDWWIEAIHTPGHTWGHLAVYDPRSKVMAAGEAALWNAILDADWKPALPPTYCYVETYLQTLEQLMEMPIEQYSGAHWEVRRGAEVREFLRESRDYCLRVEEMLLEFVKHGAFTLPEAIHALARNLGSWDSTNDGLLAYPLSGSLEHMTARGLLKQSVNEAGVFTWSIPS